MMTFFVCLSGSQDDLDSQLLDPVGPSSTRGGAQTGVFRSKIDSLVYKWLLAVL